MKPRQMKIIPSNRSFTSENFADAKACRLLGSCSRTVDKTQKVPASIKPRRSLLLPNLAGVRRDWLRQRWRKSGGAPPLGGGRSVARRGQSHREKRKPTVP
ncbi:hypothetical protein AAFF_G00246700 [Aldrovandia affinis]|uniref:Uncharacterized protein n=1 Tax=Aldrovandia affinis TaxID=143900 RepID=A0AAD7WTN8_9TELE|nr:hypothetical protein AAFF_G00246700 [Aldrovandia affinis]